MKAELHQRVDVSQYTYTHTNVHTYMYNIIHVHVCTKCIIYIIVCILLMTSLIHLCMAYPGWYNCCCVVNMESLHSVLVQN